MEQVDAGDQIDARADYIPSELETQTVPDEPDGHGYEETKFESQASQVGLFSEVGYHEKTTDQGAEDCEERDPIT